MLWRFHSEQWDLGNLDLTRQRRFLSLGLYLWYEDLVNGVELLLRQGA